MVHLGSAAEGSNVRVIGTLEELEASTAAMIGYSDDERGADHEPGDVVRAIAPFGRHPQEGKHGRVLRRKRTVKQGHLPARFVGGERHLLHWSALGFVEDEAVEAQVLAATRKQAVSSSSGSGSE